jgi:hypothetical protein
MKLKYICKGHTLMNDQLMSLAKIFTDRLFRIPDYQRGYAWGEKEITDFWNDLSRLNPDKNHYVGVLTLEPVGEEIYKKWIDDIWLIKSKKYQPYYIVDGQQRLTTSILLIKSIIEAMSKMNILKLNYTDTIDICKRFISESKDENKSKTYLFSYEENNPSYEYLIESIYQDKLSKDLSLQETTYTANLDNAKMFFAKKLEKLNVKQLEEVYSKITQHFLFNTYEISTDIDVYVTFETMNNRGKPLSHLELLKNRLIYLSTLFNIDEFNRNRLRRNINLCWKDIYHFLGKNKNNQLPDDDFLNAHFQMYFCRKLKDIYKSPNFRYRGYSGMGNIHNNYLLERYFVPQNVFSSELKVEEVFNYIDSLKESIKYWNFINNPYFSNYSDDIQEYLRKLNYLTQIRNPINGYSNIRVLLLACLERNEKEITLLKFLKILEKYMFIRLFIPFECYRDREFAYVDFQDIIIKLDKGDISITGIIEKLDKTVLSILNSAEINITFINYYSKHGFYHEEFLRYFLCEYEVALMKESKNNTEKLDRDVLFGNGYDSIEHIYPQNAHHRYWIDMFNNYTQKQKESLRNSIGNFVAISSNKNGKLANRPFPEKKGNNQNAMGYKYGTYAEIELTNYEDWGAKEIVERGIKLVNFLTKRWDIKIGNGKKEDKLEFLGLSFIINNFEDMN